MITISNGMLTASISGKGAELQRLQYKGLEYLWQGDKAYWPKHSPVLFPFVGELKNGEYLFDGKEYKMPRHGFARDRVFETLRVYDNSATFVLISDAHTLAIYPFRFVFKIKYRLEANTLFCTYLVENADGKAMYFSVGGHPAFNVPLYNGLHYSDYVLKFDKNTFLKKYILHNGLTGDDTETIHLDNKTLSLKPSLFYEDAIVLKEIESAQVELSTAKNEHALKFSFDGFPYFGIWAAKDAPFVCLEPWCGIADNIHHDQQLIHKEGINELARGESWQRTWSVGLR